MGCILCLLGSFPRVQTEDNITCRPSLWGTPKYVGFHSIAVSKWEINDQYSTVQLVVSFAGWAYLDAILVLPIITYGG